MRVEDKDVVLRGLHHARRLGKRKPGIEQHSQQWTSSGKAAAVGEQRIVGDDGAYACHDGVVLMTQLVDVLARYFARDPMPPVRAACRCAVWLASLSVPALGAAILPSSVIAALSVTNGMPVRMYFAKLSFSFFRFFLKQANVDLNSGGAKFVEALAADLRIRILSWRRRRGGFRRR